MTNKLQANKVVQSLAVQQALEALKRNQADYWVPESLIALLSGIRIRSIRESIKPLRLEGLAVSNARSNGMNYKLLPQWWSSIEAGLVVSQCNAWQVYEVGVYRDAMLKMAPQFEQIIRPEPGPLFPLKNAARPVSLVGGL